MRSVHLVLLRGLTPTRGSVPGTRWELCPRPPLYARAPRDRHGPPTPLHPLGKCWIRPCLTAISIPLILQWVRYRFLLSASRTAWCSGRDGCFDRRWCFAGHRWPSWAAVRRRRTWNLPHTVAGRSRTWKREEKNSIRYSVKTWLQLRFHYDTTTIQRYYDAFNYDGSDRNYDSTAKRLRQDYDVSHAPASIRRDLTRAKNLYYLGL